jgi:hypothetical protein
MKQYSKLIEIVDKEVNDINQLINFYNDLGVVDSAGSTPAYLSKSYKNDRVTKNRLQL